MAETDHAAAAPAIQFFTRPGCPVSFFLARRLRRLDVPVEYHDIWDDPSAAAFVRSVARGYETVPTVVIGEVVLVAPGVRQVLATAEEHAPHLLPPTVRSGTEPSARSGAGRSSRLARFFRRA